MPELLTGTQYSDQSFELAENLSAAASAKRSLGLPLRRKVPVETLSVSTIADSVDKTFKYVDVQSAAPAPKSGKMFLSESEARFLAQIGSDLDELPEPVRSSPGAELCRRFAEGDGLALAFMPRVRCAVFGDEKDGVELVAHSGASKRQVSLEFALSGRSITVVQLDEKLRRSEHECGVHHVRQLANAIEWLTPVSAGDIAEFSLIRHEGRVISSVAGQDDSLSLRGEHPAEFPTPTSAEQWIAEFRAWIASHPRLPYEADDSREGIYEGRGE